MHKCVLIEILNNLYYSTAHTQHDFLDISGSHSYWLDRISVISEFMLSVLDDIEILRALFEDLRGFLLVSVDSFSSS